MLKVELNNRSSDEDPEPRFATTTEIELAEQLRHRLEQRLLAPVRSPPASPGHSNEIRDGASSLGNGHWHEQEPL